MTNLVAKELAVTLSNKVRLLNDYMIRQNLM